MAEGRALMIVVSVSEDLLRDVDITESVVTLVRAEAANVAEKVVRAEMKRVRRND